MERKKIDLVVGKKVEQSEADKDKNHRVVDGRSTPEAQGGEVGGRSGMEYCLCPCDGAINYVYVDDDVYIWYRCWNDGCLFRV